ncbi:hypothetical protein EHW66_19660 [Erwinia psidii]|uniref:Uncharacterized protein n=1 Tax=Erwinia psidii TaxID=69224 RepID=A0A3N6SCB7_9GAMM|nr:hypothetical protein [Erwinia psidii]MCX8963265.1 hypothetical protein [Erwinia psidii]MCX8967112.1 hypothetical protein [Erwinia psidii]RQM39020.1 hypothetical protein EB241_07535 [Erwinia psidii]
MVCYVTAANEGSQRIIRANDEESGWSLALSRPPSKTAGVIYIPTRFRVAVRRQPSESPGAYMSK